MQGEEFVGSSATGVVPDPFFTRPNTSESLEAETGQMRKAGREGEREGKREDKGRTTKSNSEVEKKSEKMTQRCKESFNQCTKCVLST